MASSIQKVLETDKFSDLVVKLNAVIDYCDGTLTQSVKNAFRLTSMCKENINKVTEEMNENDIINSSILTESQMKEFINKLYS